jgi:flagellar motor protein MotB
MAVKKKGGGGGGGANWMDTYGDMVTLLLCFFVLLYSMSTISQDKWKAIVQSFNPSAVLEAQETSGNDGPIAGDDHLGTAELALGPEEMTPEEVEEALSLIFQSLQTYAEENQMEDVVQVTKGTDMCSSPLRTRCSSMATAPCSGATAWRSSTWWSPRSTPPRQLLMSCA